MSYNLSIALFLSFVLFENHQIGVITQMISFTLNKQENKRFKGNILDRTAEITVEQCLQQCLQDCRCLSFDMCSSNNECRLSTNTAQIDRNLLLSSKVCSHFEFKQENNQQCDHSCTSTMNCCLTSNPCKNGGKCFPSNTKERFHCACPKRFAGKFCQRCIMGYTGNLCEQQITSCRGYANGKRVLNDYAIFDSRGGRFRVYCDFDLDSNMTWTLIQSYNLAHVGNISKKSAFLYDLPIFQVESSWNPYRLSKFRMQSIQNDSSKWRITCDRQKNKKVNYRDYVRGLKSEVDILTFQKHGECRRVEYINVRGYNCSNCSALFYQTTYFPFHFDSRSSVKLSPPKRCDFKAHDAKECTISKNLTVGEDNFGWYECINKDHRCTATNDSNTQIWLGG